MLIKGKKNYSKKFLALQYHPHALLPREYPHLCWVGKTPPSLF